VPEEVFSAVHFSIFYKALFPAAGHHEEQHNITFIAIYF
jgi:hypothetical protein